MPTEETDPSLPPGSGEFAQRFQTLGEVNRGGIGRIAAARDPIIGRRVAIKTLRPELAENEAAAAQFAEEAQITGQLEHPNVVPIYDLGEDRGGPFIVMKLIEGESLARLLEKTQGSHNPPEELHRFIQIVLKLCDALSFAHSRGVVHCDLKPENVMVGDHGQVYLMDWGVALLVSRRAVARRSSGVTQRVAPTDEVPLNLSTGESLVRVTPHADGESSVLRGTPAYMAPEQLLGQVELIDARTDVFGLGGILFEMLTGRPPNDRQRLLGGALSEQAIPMPTESPIFAQLPPELNRITQKALAPSREGRYPDVLSLKRDLEQFLRGGGWFATEVWKAGSSILTEGESGDTAYIIEQGRCQVYKNLQGQRVFLRELGPGDVFGEMAVLTEAPRSASVVALDDVTVKVITGESLNRELDRNPWVAAFVRSLAERFRETETRLSSRPSDPPPS